MNATDLERIREENLRRLIGPAAFEAQRRRARLAEMEPELERNMLPTSRLQASRSL